MVARFAKFDHSEITYVDTCLTRVPARFL